MSSYGRPGAGRKVGVAVLAGAGIAVVSAALWYGVDALAGAGSAAGRASGGVLALVAAVAVVYGAAWGLVVGLAAVALLPGRASPGGRRTVFVVICALLVATALAGLAVFVEVPLLLLVVPALLCAGALALYLRWVPAEAR